MTLNRVAAWIVQAADRAVCLILGCNCYRTGGDTRARFWTGRWS